MSTIADLGRRIILLVGVALDAHNKEKRLQPLTYVVMSAQTALYWLRLSVAEPEDMSAIEEGVSAPTVIVAPPTLFGVREHLEYLDKEFKGVVSDLYILQQTQYSQSTLYNIQRAYDKIHEALFNTELATNYYGQLASR